MSLPCPNCTFVNEEGKQRCAICYKHLSDQEWSCHACQQWNLVSLKLCSKCKQLRTDDVRKKNLLTVPNEGKRPKSAERISRKRDKEDDVGKSHLLDIGPDRHKRSCSSDNRVQSSWNCCQCTFLNQSDSKCCEICQHSQGTCCESITKNKWLCKTCQHFNLEQFTRCTNCSKKRRKPEPDNKKDDKKTKHKHKKDPDKKSKDKKQDKKTDGNQLSTQNGQGPTPENGDQSWHCKVCSFTNNSTDRQCGTCKHNKPRIVGPSSDNKPKKNDLRRSVNAKFLRTIKTQEVEREWQNIVARCKQTNSHYIDNSFPPNDNSLFKKPRSDGSNIQWLRIGEVTDDNGKKSIQKWKVYDQPRADDIVQGSIGNCWFICALAVVAERKQLVERIVVTKDYCKEGAYVVRLCKDGSWKTVVLDDHFPVDQYKRLKYSTARRGQLWVPLIEKAAAKIHGCYEALGSGRTVESLAFLTGEPCEHLSLTESKDLSKTIDNVLIWSKLTHARDCGYLMCTSCGIEGGYTAEHCKSLGLITQHAYSLLDVYDLETGEKLVKIRNPWGKESWNGDWSDDSSKWQKVKPEVKRKLKPEENKNGIFWMDFNEFRRYFKDIDICKVRDWHETRVKGSFPSSANGPWKFVKLYVQEKTNLCLGLHQKNKRGSSNHDDFIDMFIVVMETLKNGNQRTVDNSKRGAKSYVGCDIENLEKGVYSISCLAFKHLNGGGHGSKHQLDFVLTIHSTHNVVVKETDSVTEGYTHYLADTLIQLAVDKGEHKDFKHNIASYSLSWDGCIYIIENKDKKKYAAFEQDIQSQNLKSSRGSALTQDIIPPGHRQVIMVMSTINSRTGYSSQQKMTYISDDHQTLERYGDKTRKHKPDIPSDLECLHQPRPIT